MSSEVHPLASGTTPCKADEVATEAAADFVLRDDLMTHLERMNARFRWVGGWQYERARAASVSP